MILFFHCSNLRRRLPFYTAIIQFRTTNQEQPKSTCAQRNTETEISKAVADNSKKFDKNKTVSQQGIDIPRHRTLSPAEFIFLCLQFESHSQF